MASRQKFSNNGTSTLLGAFNIGATSCSVQAGHGSRFPSPAAGELFLFTLKDVAGNIEICKCTQRTGDTFNVVVRAQEGTAERNWLANDILEARLTRDTMDQFPQKDAVETISEAWTFAKTLTQKHGAYVASANNLTLGDGNIFNITGSTTINTIATKGVGTIVLLTFAGALTLTHHVTDLILPTGANISTAAGDTAIFEEYQAGKWRCWSYQKASGLSIAKPQLTIQTFSAPGAFTWNRPAGCRAIRVKLVGAGGGGNSGNNVTGTGPGAGGGGYAEKWIDVTSVPSVAVTVGTGGTGGTPPNGYGTTGGTTSFGAYCSATGGAQAPDTADASNGGAPGTGSGGDINSTGGFGELGNNANRYGGHGGTSPLGTSGLGGLAGATGTAGVRGGGGAGGGSSSSGGAGGDGYVIVEEFY